MRRCTRLVVAFLSFSIAACISAAVRQTASAPARSSPSITDAETPVTPTSSAFGHGLSSIRASSTLSRAANRSAA